MKRAVVLIDGQNLFYNLKSLNLKEKDIDWSLLFKSFLDSGDELIRTYWFRPQKMQDGHLNKDSIRNQIVYKRYNGSYEYYKTRSFDKIPPDVFRKIEEEAKEVEQWLQEQKEHFASIEFNDQLSLAHEDIEIVKKGIVKVNPYKKEYNGEKGVDIALAVKMISISVEKKCDKIILVSGDYDYAEAINYVKNNMTKVHIVKIHKGYPPKNRNMSRDLSVLADRIIDLYEADIRSKFVKSGTSVTSITSPPQQN